MADKKRVPAARFVKQNADFSALISKLVENRVKEKAFIDEAGSYNVMTQTASLKAISKDVQESSKNTESILSLFPDMELSMQVLISSIISPKDMIGNDFIYKVREDFLTPDITGQLINITKQHIEDYYKIKEDLPEILKEILFISGAYSVAVIPENELDVIINSQSNLSTEALRNKRILDSNDNLYNVGILGNAKIDDTYTDNFRMAFESLNRIHDFTFNPNNKETAISVADDKFKKILAHEAFNKTSQEHKALLLKMMQSVKNIIITDNPDALKMPLVLNKKVSQLTNQALKTKYGNYQRIASENLNGVPDSYDIAKLRDALYKRPDTKISPFVSLSQLQPVRKNIGRPLVMRLPSEALIPVHTPGEPNNHVGYFVLVDQHGSPLHMVEKITALTELDEGLMQPDSSMNSILVERAQDNIRGKNIKGMAIDNALPIYINLVEQELMARLETGIYGKNVEISNVNEIYKIMLSRTLKNQMTKMVYMPKEMVEYMRYKIHKNGVGKALSEDLRILLSIRAMMLFSRLMGSVKNSIGITEINLKLDERDPDPLKTIEIVKNEILRARQQNFPIGISTPMDLADWVQRSGLEFTFEGHPRIPDVKLDYNQHGPSNIMPDENLDEDLRKRTIMAYGLSPETIDNGFSAEFATSVVANNILLSKRVITIQKSILYHLKSLVGKIIRSDAIIMKELSAQIANNLASIKKMVLLPKGDKISDESFIDFIINEFIEILEIELPLPETTSIDNQMAAFDKYSEFLDKALDAWASNEMFTDSTAGNLKDEMGAIKSILKSYFMRKWMTENGIMNELGDISEDISDSNIFKIQEEFLSKIIKNSVGFITGMQEMVKAVNKDFKNYDIQNPEAGGDDEFGGGGTEFGGGGTGGGDDLGLDEDIVDEDENQAETESKTAEETDKETQQNAGLENQQEGETQSI